MKMCQACWVLSVCILTSGVLAKSVADIEIDGGWQLWSVWSPCSATCGVGTETRERACADPVATPGGQQCQGAATESRTCADWHCPDCEPGIRCPDDGQQDKSCSLCLCNDDVTTGRVRESHFYPRAYLQGVLVYARGHEWKHVARTDCDGVFTIKGLCQEGTELMFLKEGYHAEYDSYAAGQDMTGHHEVKMFEARKPKITVEPESNLLEEGGGVYLRCEANGKPPVTAFRWYKDGELVDFGEETSDTTNAGIELRNLTVAHSGDYQCVAVSSAGATWSRPANLLVYTGDGVEPEDGGTCVSEPTTKHIHLHESCTTLLDGEQVASVDMGACSRNACPYVPLPDAVAGPTPVNGPTGPLVGCCGPTDVTLLNVNCEGGFSYPLSQVRECGCHVSMPDRNPGVTIEGIVRMAVFREGRMIGWENVPSFHFQAYGGKGTTSATTTEGGEFIIFLLPLGKTVTLDFYTHYQNYDFFPQVGVIRLQEGVYTYRTIVHLRERPRPVRISAEDFGDGQTLELPKLAENKSPGSITLPEVGLLTVWGDPLPDGSVVDVFLDFTSTRRPEEFATSPGEMLYEDDDGELRYLKTYGQLWIQNEYDNKVAHTDCPCEIVLQPSEAKLPAPKSCELNPKLWVLGKKTGQWKPWAKLERIAVCDESTYGKKASDPDQGDKMKSLYGSPSKRSSGSGSTWRPGRVAQAKASMLWDRPVFNIAEDLPRTALCEIAVRVFRGPDGSSQPLSGEQVAVHSVDTKQDRLVTFLSSFTDADGKVCLVVPCGHRHTITVWSLYGATASTSHHLQPGFTFQNIDDGRSVQIGSPPANDIVSGDPSGPVHRYIHHTCATSTLNDYYISFHTNDAPVPNVLNAVEIGTGKLLSWYHYIYDRGEVEDKKPACFVRVAIQTADPHNTQVVATSRFGEDSEGDFYGTYTAGVHSIYDAETDAPRQGDHFACVQVKCAGDLVDEDGQVYENVATRVDLRVLPPSGKTCRMRWIAEYLIAQNSSREDNRRMLPLNIRSYTNESVSIVLNPVSYWDGWDFDTWMPGFYREIGREGITTSVDHTYSDCVTDSHDSVALIDCAEETFGTEWWDERDPPGTFWELDVDGDTSIGN